MVIIEALIGLVSLGSKLLGSIIISRLRNIVDKVLREEDYCSREWRGCGDQIFAFRLIKLKKLVFLTENKERH